ncbi:MAG: hypothetical protein C0501_22650 [Isosphaera sp.]|nr:hypothetical protein [Isosphaera sp.]
MKTLTSAFAALLLAAPGQAALIHQYRLDGSFADDLGGPSLVPAGGVLGPTSYAFGPNQGLSLSNALPGTANATYSIELVFRFNTLTGFRKIIDFQNRASDNGFYTLDTALNFFPQATGPDGAFALNTDARVVLTRNDLTDQVVGYVNGVPQFTFVDVGNIAVFGTPNRIINFFIDDTVVTGEASGGVVDLIRIYDTALTGAEVAALVNPGAAVPEPASVVLLAAGAAGVVGYRRRRGRPVT